MGQQGGATGGQHVPGDWLLFIWDVAIVPSFGFFLKQRDTMARLERAESFDSNEVAMGHVHNRTVRRCFLMGIEDLSGKNSDRGKVWIEAYLQQFAAALGIDLLDFAIVSNCFHLILRTPADVVATWDDRELTRRWLLLCQYVAQRANPWRKETGRFFQDR